MGRYGKTAVVIGASIAGLSAARVLSEFYDHVTVYDRDALPVEPANRSAVPQGRHVHILMARGAEEIAWLFPGLLEDMDAAGVHVVRDQPGSIHFGAAGHALGIPNDPKDLQQPFTTYVPSRPHFEWQIRKHTQKIPNVELSPRAVHAPKFDAAAERVTGVVLDNADGEFVPADLVVDATGRGTRLPVWMEEWGYGRPREDTVDVGIGYSSVKVQVPDGLLTEKFVVAGASRENPLGLGMMFYEDDHWVVTTFGVAKVEPPTEYEQMCALADEILPDHLAKALRQGRPVSEVAIHKYPMSRWRRYDKADRYPAGIVPIGDAVVSFNPTYGQGMTMSLLQVGNLHKVLSGGTTNLWRDLNKATAKIAWPVWMMDAIGDHTLQQAQGPAPKWYGPVGNLFDQFLLAAENEPVLAEWFLRRLSMLDSLWMIPPPRIVARTMRYNLRCWLAERKEAKRERKVAAAA